MKRERRDDWMGMVSEELMRQCIAELLHTETERKKLRLQRERADAKSLQRLIATAAVIAVLINVWF